MKRGALINRTYKFIKMNSKCGNTSCFLFNLTKNIRFDAIKGKGFYQFCPNLVSIKFGETDLVFDVQINIDISIGTFREVLKRS